MNFLKIPYGNNIIYLNMEKVKTVLYNPDVKTISVCYNGETVIDHFVINDEIKLQFEKFGIYLKDVEK